MPRHVVIRGNSSFQAGTNKVSMAVREDLLIIFVSCITLSFLLLSPVPISVRGASSSSLKSAGGVPFTRARNNRRLLVVASTGKNFLS